MDQFVYDHSLEGFLTAVFEVYKSKARDPFIVREAYQQATLFGRSIIVETDEAKADRVWKGIEEKGGGSLLRLLYRVFLSELADREQVMLKVIQRTFEVGGKVIEELHLPEVMRLQEINKMMGREKHRFEAFVRFRKLKDGRFYALIDPDFDVLPLILPHFVSRYADQHWVIHDVKRRYAISYDTKHWQVLRFAADAISFSDIPISEWDESEHAYEQLWQSYFKAVNIPARRNTKLHVQHVPKRYWKYLWEKKLKL